MKSELTIGKVLKPRGLKGELKLELYTSDSARFSRLKRLTVQGIEYNISHISIEGMLCYVQLEGIDSVEKAEPLRNQLVACRRDALPKLPDGKYYIVDMLGLEVFCGGESLGFVADVLQYGSADVYVVKNGDSSLSFPAIKGLIKQVDIEGGRLIVDDMLFARTVVYNT